MIVYKVQKVYGYILYFGALQYANNMMWRHM